MTKKAARKPAESADRTDGPKAKRPKLDKEVLKDLEAKEPGAIKGAYRGKESVDFVTCVRCNSL